VTATRAEQIRDLAYRDLLTSALSRRGLYAALPFWVRQHTPGAAVAVLDINGFKAVNDALGHEKGDQVLQALAEVCTASLPAGALFARFGGDEFVALMPKATPFENTLTATAASFQKQCAELLAGVALANTPEPTVAIGHASLDGRSMHDFETALRAADAMMYSRKIRAT
jgi:diguanylate cyclase (GGDEF)-like protein